MSSPSAAATSSESGDGRAKSLTTQVHPPVLQFQTRPNALGPCFQVSAARAYDQAQASAAVAKVHCLEWVGGLVDELAEWSEDFEYDLQIGSGVPTLLTLAIADNEGAAELLIETARKLIEAEAETGPVDEVSARHLTPDTAAFQHVLARRPGFLIVRDVEVPLNQLVISICAAHQHRIQEDTQAGLLVIGTPAGIAALRAHPAMGFLGRATPLDMR
jgi:hypothetical protein